MNSTKFFLILSITTLMMQSCYRNQNDLKTASIRVEDYKGSVIADSIIYDVIIRDIDNQDPWEAERLKGFNQEMFISYVFSKLYTGQFAAYNFETKIRLSTSEIKNIEHKNGYDRKKISKVQFNEMWYIDSLGIPSKRINSIILGLESYSKQGTFLGHEALFEVKFEPTE